MGFPKNKHFQAGFDAGYQANPPVYAPHGLLITELQVWTRGYDQGRKAWSVDTHQGRLELESAS